METVTVYNVTKTKTYEATVLFRRNGETFVECPTMGNESPMLLVRKDGTLEMTDSWDLLQGV